MIALIELTKRYGSTLPVDRLTLEVQRGEIFGFLGRNGAGKTTTIRMMMGLLQPTAGRVVLGGHDLARAACRWHPSLAGIGASLGAALALTVAVFVGAVRAGIRRLSALDA